MRPSPQVMNSGLKSVYWFIQGCSFGYHAGGWGKPPVDERGRPLYGDVFGVEVPVNPYEDEKPSEQLWGEIDSDEESSSEDESTDESEEEGDQDGTGVPTAVEPSKEQFFSIRKWLDSISTIYDVIPYLNFLIKLKIR